MKEPKWDKMEISPYRYSKRNWMKGIVANRNAVKTYQEIEPPKVPGDKYKSFKGLFMMRRGRRV